jgi:hypothetical protein
MKTKCKRAQAVRQITRYANRKVVQFDDKVSTLVVVLIGVVVRYRNLDVRTASTLLAKTFAEIANSFPETIEAEPLEA